MTDLPYLPVEIVRIIIGYVDDIDIKRYFNCYNKINLEKYYNLTNIMINPPININNEWMVSTIYNFKKNLYDCSERKQYKVPDDHIAITHDKEKSYITIHRLTLKSTADYLRKLEDEYGYCSSALITNSVRPPPYLYGPLGDYRWEVIKTIR